LKKDLKKVKVFGRITLVVPFFLNGGTLNNGK